MLCKFCIKRLIAFRNKELVHLYICLVLGKHSNWKQYVERLEIFFEVNNVPVDKQASSILTLMGSKMYALLRSITAPRRPKELT